MSTIDDLMRGVLDHPLDWKRKEEFRTALESALRAEYERGRSEREQGEPVAWITEEPDGNESDGSYGGMLRDVVLGAERPDFGTVPLYAAPPKRKRLTEQEIWDAVDHGIVGGIGLPTKAVTIARAIERAHGIGDE